MNKYIEYGIAAIVAGAGLYAAYITVNNGGISGILGGAGSNTSGSSDTGSGSGNNPNGSNGSGSNNNNNQSGNGNGSGSGSPSGTSNGAGSNLPAGIVYNSNANVVNSAGATYTNTGNTAVSISGSGQTLNPSSTLVVPSSGNAYISTPTGYGTSTYTTSLNTKAYGTPIGTATAVTGGSYNGIPTTLGSNAGTTVQKTSTGFYKITNPNGSVVYTKINPNG